MKPAVIPGYPPAADVPQLARIGADNRLGNGCEVDRVPGPRGPAVPATGWEIIAPNKGLCV